MKLKRPLRGSESGADVRMVQRALNRWARRVPRVEIPETGTYDRTTSDRVMAFQAEQKIKPASGDFGQRTLNLLWPWFDAYGKAGYATFRPPPVKTPADVTFERLLAAMQAMDRNSQGYILGAGHGVPLRELRSDRFFDCSSSCSFALWQAGLFEGERAIVSGEFARAWGKPGRGEYLTVWANVEHVFIQLHRSRWWRFDTSPHSGGRPSENPRRGPRLRYFPRFTSGFTPRRWEGM